MARQTDDREGPIKTEQSGRSYDHNQISLLVA